MPIFGELSLERAGSVLLSAGDVTRISRASNVLDMACWLGWGWKDPVGGKITSASSMALEIVKLHVSGWTED